MQTTLYQAIHKFQGALLNDAANLLFFCWEIHAICTFESASKSGWNCAIARKPSLLRAKHLDYTCRHFRYIERMAYGEVQSEQALDTISTRSRNADVHHRTRPADIRRTQSRHARFRVDGRTSLRGIRGDRSRGAVLAGRSGKSELSVDPVLARRELATGDTLEFQLRGMPRPRPMLIRCLPAKHRGFHISIQPPGTLLAYSHFRGIFEDRLLA